MEWHFVKLVNGLVGNVHLIQMKIIPPLSIKRLERFWFCIDKTKDCWEWQGYILDSGYGQFKINSTNYRVHRIAFMLVFGQPKGIVMHICNNRRCCNAVHLIDGTNADNSAYMVLKGRSHKPKGELHPRRKLNSQQVGMIRQSKGTCKSVGNTFGVSASLICMIRNNKIWIDT